MSSLIAAGITAAAGLGSSAINAGMQARTNAMNKQQADEAYRRQVEAIKEQNIYNSPAMQVARMKAAGLNPSLAYGADGALVGEQTDLPAYSPIPAESPNIGSLGNVASSAIAAGLSVREQENRNDLAIAEITTKDAQTFAYLMQGHLSSAQEHEVLSLLGYRIDNLESSTDLNNAQIERFAKLNEVSDEEMKEIRSRIGLNDEQVKTLASQYKLNQAQVYRIFQSLPHELNLMDAQAAFAFVQSDVGRATIEKIAADIYDMDFYHQLNSQKFIWDKDKFKTELDYKMQLFEFDKHRWKSDYRQRFMLGVSDNVSKVSGTIVGAAIMKGLVP